MIREELAWAAGFFDGEGNVGFYQKRGRRRFPHGQLSLTLMQTDPEVLERFRVAVGLGKVYGPYEVRNTAYPNRRPQWRYSVQSLENTQAVIAMLWAWLSSVKRAQAYNAMTAYKADQVEMLAAGRITA